MAEQCSRDQLRTTSVIEEPTDEHSTFLPQRSEVSHYNNVDLSSRRSSGLAYLVVYCLIGTFSLKYMI